MGRLLVCVNSLIETLLAKAEKGIKKRKEYHNCVNSSYGDGVDRSEREGIR